MNRTLSRNAFIYFNANKMYNINISVDGEIFFCPTYVLKSNQILEFCGVQNLFLVESTTFQHSLKQTYTYT